MASLRWLENIIFPHFVKKTCVKNIYLTSFFFKKRDRDRMKHDVVICSSRQLSTQRNKKSKHLRK